MFVAFVMVVTIIVWLLKVMCAKVKTFTATTMHDRQAIASLLIMPILWLK